MRHVLQRHSFSVKAHFRNVLVLTYALPKEVLAAQLPPGLVVDSLESNRGDLGFVAIAMVQTDHLRPAVLPRWTGQNFFLTGYRIFAKYKTRSGRTLRGLRILRSDADRRHMIVMGNLLTHYNYHLADIRCIERPNELEINVSTPDTLGDLHVTADLQSMPASLPKGSPFGDEHAAQRFAGPLPYTFDYEPQTHSMVMIKGVRQHWSPRLIDVNVHVNRFFESDAFAGVEPIFASAFHTRDIDYQWLRGTREKLDGGA